ASFSSRASRTLSFTASNSSPDHVEVAQDALGLAAEQRLELASYARRDACRIVHQAGHFVEKTVRGLGHGWCLRRAAYRTQWRLAAAAASRRGNLTSSCAARERPREKLGIAMPLLALPFPALNPVIVEIGPFAIRWYALAYIAGILL